MSEAEKCKQMIRDEQRSSRFHAMKKRCAMNATTAAGYCRMHDPELRDLADKKRMEAYHAKLDAEMRRTRLNDAAPDLLAACEAALDLTLKYARPADDTGYQASNLLTIRLREVIAKAKRGESK